MTKVLNQQLSELKDLIKETNDKISALDQRVSDNHNELIDRIAKVEHKVNEAHQNTLKNEREIFDIKNNHDELKKEIDTKLAKIKNDIKQEINITKLETQLKAALIELEDLRNRSMRSTLVFKNIKGENNESWEDTARILGNYIVDELGLGYAYEEMDYHISRAHRGGANQEDTNQEAYHSKGPKPIYAQFVNWRTAEEIRNKIITLNSRKQTRVVCNQMFSKDLTLRRNNALKYRRETLNDSPGIQIKLEYPAILKSRKKGSNGKWEVLQTF